MGCKHEDKISIIFSSMERLTENCRIMSENIVRHDEQIKQNKEKSLWNRKIIVTLLFLLVGSTAGIIVKGETVKVFEGKK